MPLAAFFYGLCRFWLIDIRQPQDAADFELPEIGPSGLYVVIDEGRDRTADYDVLATSGEHVVVLDRIKLNSLRMLDSVEHITHQLGQWQRTQASASYERRYGPTR